VHAANTFLVWRLIRTFLERVCERTPRDAAAAAGFGALLFAVHPLQVGAVAWISGGRDLFAAFFALIAVLLLCRSEPGRRWYLGATLSFTLALLAKPSVAALPAAVIAFDVVFSGNWRRTTLRMVPWLLLVLVDALGTRTMQREMSRVSVPVAERPLVAADAAGFYVSKTVWPARLTIDYGRTPQLLREQPGVTVSYIAVLVFAIVVVGWLAIRKKPYRVAILWPILVAPILGLVPFAFQRISTVADHYAYLSLAVVGALAAVAISENKKYRRWVWSAASAIMLLWGIASWRRAAVWRDDDTLFSDALSQNPHSFVALVNVGKKACETKRFDDGLRALDDALALRRDETSAVADKAYCLYNASRFDEVLEMRTIADDPDVAFGLDHNADAASGFANVIAGALFQEREKTAGWMYLCAALALNPTNADLQANAADIAESFRTSGQAVPPCPPRVDWRALASIR
jgi:protein O-mannosyl-transferase